MLNWIAADLGSAQAKGRMTQKDGSYTVVAGGRDIWDREDAGFFAFVNSADDFDFCVRFEYLEMTNLYSKAGIMVRESIDAESRNLFFAAFGDNGPRRNNNGGCELQFRDETGGESLAIYPEKTESGEPRYPAAYPNFWLRVKRTGNECAAYHSSDGHNWLLYGKHLLPFYAALVGVCVTAHDEERTCECRFSDVTFR